MSVFRCEVDLYRNGKVFRNKDEYLYDRRTQGVYYVGAKTAKDARAFLQKRIGFGSITVPRHQDIPDEVPNLKAGQIVRRQVTNWKPLTFGYTSDIRHATDPVNNNMTIADLLYEVEQLYSDIGVDFDKERTISEIERILQQEISPEQTISDESYENLLTGFRCELDAYYDIMAEVSR